MVEQKNLYSKGYLSGENPKLRNIEKWLGGGSISLMNFSFLVYIIIKTALTNYSGEHPHIIFEHVVMILLLIASIAIYAGSTLKGHQRLYHCHIWLIDIRRFFLSIIFLSDILILLVVFKQLVDPTTLLKLGDARMEWTVAVGTIIGIVGALWALIAKMDATRSFMQAKDANEKASEAHIEAKKSADTAMDAYRAIAGIVSFEDMLVPDGEKQGVPMLHGMLNAAYEELIMVLGVPAVGYFRKVKEEDESGNVVSVEFPLKENSTKFCHELANFIRDLSSPDKKDLKTVRLFYFDDETLESYNRSAINNGEMTMEESELLNDSYDDLKKAIEHLPKEIIDSGRFQYRRYNVELGLRFVIAHSQLKAKMTEEKALVWVVSDFKPNYPGDFGAAGFTTLDKNIIDNLRRLSKGYLDTLPNLVDTSETTAL